MARVATRSGRGQLERLRERGELLAARSEDGEWSSPARQFGPGGKVPAGVRDSVAAARAVGLSEHGLLSLLRRRVGLVGGGRFFDLLFEGRADTVVAAIRAAFGDLMSDERLPTQGYDGRWKQGRIDNPGRSLMKRITLALGVALAAFVVAGPVTAGSTAAKAVTVNVTAKEFKFTLSKKSVPHGKVTFKLANKGKLPHDFAIGGKKTKIIGAGKTATLIVTLKKGKAAYKCTVPGHAAAGMKGTLKVT